MGLGLGFGLGLEFGLGIGLGLGLGFGSGFGLGLRAGEHEQKGLRAAGEAWSRAKKGVLLLIHALVHTWHAVCT